jgi:hypothetical protein
MAKYEVRRDEQYPMWPYLVYRDGEFLHMRKTLRQAKRLIKRDKKCPEGTVVYTEES